MYPSPKFASLCSANFDPPSRGGWQVVVVLRRMNVQNPERRQDLKQTLAARLRDNATDAERKLWAMLRRGQIAGLRFRRQQPIGPYVVDFYCSAAKLIIELDGDQHGSDSHALYDRTRTCWLMVRGYCVLRFANGEFLKNPQTVLDGIAHVLEGRAVPLPEICETNFDPRPTKALTCFRSRPRPSRGG